VNLANDIILTCGKNVLTWYFTREAVTVEARVVLETVPSGHHFKALQQSMVANLMESLNASI